MTPVIKKYNLKQILPVIFLLILSSIIVFYKFNEIPQKLFHDEGDFMKLTLSLDHKPYTPYSTLATGHSTLYFYTILTSFKIFGVNNFGLRFPSAIFGVLNVILFYFILSLSFRSPSLSFRAESRNPFHTKKRDPSISVGMTQFIPFILTIVFMTMHWYFNFARFSFEATFLLFLELTSILFFLRYNQHNKTLDICLSALFAGLAYNSYTPGRIFFILIFGFLIGTKTPFLQFIKRRYLFFCDLGSPVRKADLEGPTGALKNMVSSKNLTESGHFRSKNIILSIIIFIVIISPLSFYLATQKDDRFDKQFFLKNTEMTINEKIDFLARNITSTTLMFINQGDINARHNYPGKPAINPILGVLTLFGLILTIFKYRSGFNLFFLAYFALSILPPILTYPWENPNMLRSFAVIPSLVYFIGNSLIYFLNLKFNKKLILGIIIAVLLASSIYELRTYFLYQAPLFNTSS